MIDTVPIITDINGDLDIPLDVDINIDYQESKDIYVKELNENINKYQTLFINDKDKGIKIIDIDRDNGKITIDKNIKLNNDDSLKFKFVDSKFVLLANNSTDIKIDQNQNIDLLSNNSESDLVVKKINGNLLELNKNIDYNHEDEIVIYNSTTIYAGLSNGKLVSIDKALKDNITESIINNSTTPINTIILSNDKKFILFSNDLEVNKYTIDTKEITQLYISDSESNLKIKNICISNDDDYFMSGLTNGKAIQIKIDTPSVIFNKYGVEDDDTKPINKLIITKDDKYLLGGQGNKVRRWQISKTNESELIESDKTYNNFHTGDINTIVLTKNKEDKELFITGSNDSKIGRWSINDDPSFIKEYVLRNGTFVDKNINGNDSTVYDNNNLFINTSNDVIGNQDVIKKS